MSNLEHLVENGLCILENGYSSEEWFNRMSADINWEYVENITVDDLWEICQYVFYTWSKILIDSALTIDAVSEWIPCSERLPSENGFYLVTYPLIDGEPWVQVLRFSNGKFYSNDVWGDVEFDDVTAWMPLPKPYGERKGE